MLLPLLLLLTASGAEARDSRAKSLPIPKNITNKCSPDNLDHQTSSSCNVCKDCCQDMNGFSDPQAACDSCVEWKCRFNGPKWNEASFAKPKIHYAPSCLMNGGWHDIAAAATHKGLHHIFFGCDATIGGWHHAVSDDLVHFTELKGAPRQIQEGYAGMSSFSTPCSGFITFDEDGTPCAGFRQCGSSESVTGFDKDENGNNVGWNVPMEVRCASDDYLTEWNDPDFLFNVSYYRSVPYDPARPWIDEDGNWYMLVSIDACNATTKELPCDQGGALMLYMSEGSLHGPKSDWQQLGIVYETEKTVMPNTKLTKEMVTIDFVGGLKGDPFGGKTRVFFNNVGGNGGGEGCCSGTTSYTVVRQEEPGAKFDVNTTSNFDGVGMVDWGAFPIESELTAKGCFGRSCLGETQQKVYSMARTLGSENPNQVLDSGRKVMYAWMKGGDPNSIISLGRDLGLDENLTLTQEFVPELQSLRINGSHVSLPAEESALPGMYAEVYAEFSNLIKAQKLGFHRFGINVLQCGEDEYTRVGIDLNLGLAVVDGRLQGRSYRAGGPLVFGDKSELSQMDKITVHAYVDGGMVEAIFNNRTAIASPATPSSGSCGGVTLYGLEPTDESDNPIQAKVDVWALEGANASPA